MLISVGLELNYEGRALAWALDFPGCFAYGEEGPDAVIALARALVAYENWIDQHGGLPGFELGDFDLRIVDTWTVYTIDDHYNLQEGGYAVNAWFRSDWKPLSEAEIERGLTLLDWSRADLLEMTAALSVEQLERKDAGERWSIRGILKHIAGAEWWYLDRLGLAQGEREQLSQDVFERLNQVRSQLKQVLPDLARQERVLGKEGEFWSPRKLLRRALEHEIDHRQHIQKLLQQAPDEGI